MRNKKLFVIIIIILIFFSNQLKDLREIELNFKTEKETILPHNAYNLVYSTIPFWKNTIMYNESIMFVGKTSIAPLLYTLTEIISITSYDGTITYYQGIDYFIQHGKIYLTPDTRIPFFTLEEYYPNVQDSTTLMCSNSEYKYLKFSEGDYFQSRQVLVTYYHDDHDGNNIQECYFYKFDKFFKKLRNAQNPTLLFYGDSITVGANASGFLNKQTFTPSWTKMVHSFLAKKFETTINYINTSVGGTNSSWAVKNFQERVIKYNPDFLVLAFGMNDNIPKNDFKNNIYKMIEAIKIANNDIKILLVSTTLPNKEALGFSSFQNTYEMGLNELANSFSYIGLARMTSMHNFLLGKKRFYDMTGNNVNHPNDFLTRIYCHTVLKSLLDDY